MMMPGRTYSATSGYRYGFNGKEVQESGANYDYGFRIYDDRIGRFTSIDPLTSAYPWYTPYQFAGNKPINSIDLDGLEELTVISSYKNTAVIKINKTIIIDGSLPSEIQRTNSDKMTRLFNKGNSVIFLNQNNKKTSKSKPRI